jgi:hypothetical protein
MPAPKKLTQILPSVRYMPILPVTREWENEIIEIVDRALKRNGLVNVDFDVSGSDLFPSMFAPERARHAAEMFVSAKRSEMPLPDFRKAVDRTKKGSLAHAADALLKLLKSDNEPPFVQMRELYCKQDPAVDGFDESERFEDAEDGAEQPVDDDPPFDDETGEPKAVWRTKYSPEILTETLTQWLQLMDELRKQSLGGAKVPGRTRIVAETRMVDWLAGYWHKDLGLPLASSRDSGKTSHGQQGDFADFVKKTEEIIPLQYRPQAWDHAIRENLPKKP